MRKIPRDPRLCRPRSARNGVVLPWDRDPSLYPKIVRKRAGSRGRGRRTLRRGLRGLRQQGHVSRSARKIVDRDRTETLGVGATAKPTPQCNAGKHNFHRPGRRSNALCRKSNDFCRSTASFAFTRSQSGTRFKNWAETACPGSWRRSSSPKRPSRL